MRAGKTAEPDSLNRMRIIFAGTPDFARVALERLQAAGFEIALVLTQPDRPAGRGLKLQASSVKQFALEKGIPVVQPRSLRLDGKYPEDAVAARKAIEAADAQAMVVAAYGLILPQWVLTLMSEVPDRPQGVGRLKFGCLNIHASLLPRWRGAAPIHRAIEAGDRETGVTIMQMDAGLDTGDMLLVEKLPIVHEGPQADTTGMLHDKLAALGGRLIVEALELAASGGLQPVPQAGKGVSYAHKIEKHEARIDWHLPADQIDRRIRAFNPFPGAFTELKGETFKIWSARPSPAMPPATAVCGEILTVAHGAVEVCAMSSTVQLLEIQRAGGKRLKLADFLHGFELKPGTVFDSFTSDKADMT